MFDLRFRSRNKFYKTKQDSLEAGEYNDFRRFDTDSVGSARVSQYIIFAASVTLLALLSLFTIGILSERENIHTRAERMLITHQDNPCAFFKTNTVQVIILPSVQIVMVSPRIISLSSSMVLASESFEDTRCVGKTVQRSRHAALAARYVTVDAWPFGKRRSISVTDEQAVCVQHAIDDFEGILNCDSK